MEDGGWLLRFPELSRDALRAIKKSFDFGYRQFSRTYGEAIENVFEPLLQFLIWFEDFFTETPWMLIILGIATLAWLASRSWKLVIGIVVSFMLIGVFGMWEHTMQTMAMIVVCTILALIIGLPIGILMSRYDRAQSAIMPILDVMQTMPSFVYLIPVVMLLGIGRVPGLIAVIIYAVPPMIRLTNLGIRLVDKEVLEAADAFGASYWQRLTGVQIPLAMPNIMAGVNQTIMMALAMVVIASMIGVRGLGQPVLKAVTNQYFAVGLFNGLAIVALAIVFDRITQAYGRRLQEHTELR
jgi:glycine betaine/proline transport system permease protein